MACSRLSAATENRARPAGGVRIAGGRNYGCNRSLDGLAVAINKGAQVMPVRVSRLTRVALKHFAKRMAAGEQLMPRFNIILHEHRKLLRDLVRDLLSQKEQP